MRRLFYFFTAREQVAKAGNFCTDALPLAITFDGITMWRIYGLISVNISEILGEYKTRQNRRSRHLLLPFVCALQKQRALGVSS